MSKGIAVVTGANNGIGFETTLGLAHSGYQVVMACRNEGKAEKAKGAVLNQVPEAELSVMLVDMSSFESVRDFVRRFKEQYSSLNLLINNAGILDLSGRESADGYDLQFATNYLGHFLLTSLLLDLMPDEPASRVVSLGSVAHKTARLHIDEAGYDTIWNQRRAYGQSKLACIMFGDELNRRLVQARRKVLSVSAHPGGAGTGIFDDMWLIMRLILKALSPIFMQSAAEGAKPILHAALSDNVIGGGYFGPQRVFELKGPVGVASRSAALDDPDAATRLWEISEQLVDQRFDV